MKVANLGGRATVVVPGGDSRGVDIARSPRRGSILHSLGAIGTSALYRACVFR